MTSEQLRATRDAIPFAPFVIHMTDGQTFPVPHRDYLHIFPNGRIAVVSRINEPAVDILDVMLISRLSIESPDAFGNGPRNNGS